MLVDVELPPDAAKLPREVRCLLAEADQRIDAHLRMRPASAHGFVASDFVAVYHALRQITTAHLAPGSLFCEWGSGFGVVTLLAALLDFDACGIEIDYELVQAAEALASDLDITAQFAYGSFIPPGGEALAEQQYAAEHADFHWLETDADDAYEQLEIDPDDIDLVFVYPWPNEHQTVMALFEEFAANEALLLMYGHTDSMRLVRKTRT